MQIQESIFKYKLVLDANAFIKQQNLSSLSNNYKFYLPYSVSYEIRDKKAKEFLDGFPFELSVVNPSTASCDFVKGFARATGDLGVLSEEDIDLIALAYELVVDSGCKDELRKSPPNFVSNFIKQLDLGKNKEKEEEEVQLEESDIQKEKVEEDEDDDGFMEIIDPKASKKKEEKKSNSIKKETKMEEENASDSESDSEIDWITPSNNKAVFQPCNSISPEIKATGVAVISSDFAIQNVLLQLGIPLITLDGVRIKNVKKWVLFCYTCQNVVKEVEKKFCPACGNATLNRLSCSVEANGGIRCFFKKNYKYPIPKYRGGRKGNDIILRADEFLMAGRDIALRNEKKRKDNDFKSAISNIDNNFEIDNKRSKKGRNLEVGFGKMNPNNAFEYARKKGKFK